MTPRTGALFVLAATVLFGTTGTAQALGPDELDSLAVGAARVVIGGALLFLWAWTRGAFRDRPAPYLPHVLLGGMTVATYQIGFFTGVQWAGVAVGTVIALGSGPIWTGLIEWIFGRRRPSPIWACATLLAILGSTILVLAGTNGDGGERQVEGVLLALLAGLGYGVYTVVGSRMILAGQRDDGAMGLVFGAGAVLLLPVLLLRWPGGLDSAPGFATVLYLALVPTVAAYRLFGAGLKVLPAATVATLTLAEPVVATVLGIAVLDEEITRLGLGGAALVLAGLSLIALPVRRSRPVTTPAMAATD
ncbi:MAG: EamA family transporter [Chloroflexota bacterium]|nr:EamA family transporter [Chloroflexota bacterium]